MLRSKPILLHLMRVARRKLISHSPKLELPVLKSSDWIANLEGAYREIEGLDRHDLGQAQIESRYLLLTYSLLYKRTLVSPRRLTVFIRLAKSAAKQHASGGTRYAENNNKQRDHWFRQQAKEMPAHLSISQKSVLLAKRSGEISKLGYNPVGPQSIRKILRSKKAGN